MSRHGTRTVMTCMRNEGLYLLEWVAHHRQLGFDHIVVFTNDCTDGSDLMLDRLDELGELTHIRNQDYGSLGPQGRALQRAMADVPQITRADWVLSVDADEFLDIEHGDHSLDALLDIVEPFDACALAWVPFGDSGHERWADLPVMQRFAQRDDRPKWSKLFHKPLFRPAKFQSLAAHMPKSPIRPDIRQCNAAGDEIDAAALFVQGLQRHKGMEKSKLIWDGARINHYAIRSRDAYLMKNDRGDVTGQVVNKYFLNSTYHRRYNTNLVEDRSIQRYLPAVTDLMAAYRSDPLIHHLEEAAKAWFINRRDRVLTPEQILAWTLEDGDATTYAKTGAPAERVPDGR